MHTHRVGQAPLRRGGLFTTRAAARRDVTAAQRRPKVPCASGLVFRRPAQIWEAGRWLHIGTFGLLGILLVTTVRPHPSRRRRPASRSCPFERAAASGTQSGHSPHPCSAFATFCRSARSKRAVIRRQRHTPVQSLLPSCRRPNSSRCAGAMGHWLCAFFPRDVCAVCVCGCALRCSESFGWRNELAHRPGRARGSFAFGMGSVHGRMPARSARADPPQRRACGVRICAWDGGSVSSARRGRALPPTRRVCVWRGEGSGRWDVHVRSFCAAPPCISCRAI